MVDVKLGATVKLGNHAGKPLEWLVIDKKGKKCFLLCKYYVAKGKFSNEQGMGFPWKNSDVRLFLNSIFFETAFAENEKNMILNTYVLNNSGWLYDNNLFEVETSTYGTYDRIFCLSVEEVIKYWKYIDFLEDFTNFQIDHKYGIWYTRTVDKRDIFNYVVDTGIFKIDYQHRVFPALVRPAMWINCKYLK